MPSARHKLALGGILAATAVCCAAIITTPGRPKFHLTLTRVVDVQDRNTLPSLDFRFSIEDTNEDSVVIVRVHNSGSRRLTLGHEEVQCRVRGKWLPPEVANWLNSTYFVATVQPRSEGDF